MKKTNLETSLVGRKCRAKYNHLWFGRDSGSTGWDEPMPTDEATIVAVYTSREEGVSCVKALLESEKGETKEFYAESFNLVPQVKP